MRVEWLASQIERELQAGGWNDCAVYEHDLIRVWPLDEPEREAKIAKFARSMGSASGSTGWECARSSTNGPEGLQEKHFNLKGH